MGLELVDPMQWCAGALLHRGLLVQTREKDAMTTQERDKIFMLVWVCAAIMLVIAFTYTRIQGIRIEHEQEKIERDYDV